LVVALLTPQSLAQWVGVAGRVLTGRDTDGPSIERSQCHTLELSADPPQRVEVDGDVLGKGSRLRVSIEPRALVVRVVGAA
jgi:diacylglycerol kinase (ATP)